MDSISFSGSSLASLFKVHAPLRFTPLLLFLASDGAAAAMTNATANAVTPGNIFLRSCNESQTTGSSARLAGASYRAERGSGGCFEYFEKVRVCNRRSDPERGVQPCVTPGG